MSGVEYEHVVYKGVEVPEVLGPIGKSAYAVALDNGFVGTEAEWLASLKGADGDAGSGAMLAATYDPTGIEADAFDRGNHTGTQPLSTISDAGTAAAEDVEAFATADQGGKADNAVQPAGLTKTAVGLGSVDDTSDADKPVSTAQLSALDGKATSAQGAKADSAVQPDALAAVATSGDYGDLENKPTIPAGLPTGGTTGQVASKASGADFDVAWTDPPGSGGAVDSVNGATGVVVLDADDIDDAATTNRFTTAVEASKLAGIATAATANSTDAILKARANHTGTQTADTITDGTTNKAFLATERTKLTGIATGADVTTQAKVIAASGFIVVNHGATADTARPADALAVYWVGTVEPTNATNADQWEDQS